jgi:hypothetical protein
MTATLTDVPPWVTPPKDQGELSGRDELHTAFGLYMLALELTASSRQLTGSQRLLIYWRPKGPGYGPGFSERIDTELVSRWGRELNLLAASRSPGPAQLLSVGVSRMRITHTAREQRPVAHTKETLADVYLRRDPSTLVEYQKVVAQVLTKEVLKARALGSIPLLSADDLAEAARDPAAVARRVDVSTELLRLLISRDADTVLTSCVDNNNSPFGQPNEPCQASFLKCLECPCARALPHHLPIQIAARDLLQQRRNQVSALNWARRFSVPAARLDDLLASAGAAAVDAAQNQITNDHRDLVERLLAGELDKP